MYYDNNNTSKPTLQGNFSDNFLNSIKDRTPEILLRVLRPANKNGAICPFCDNGSGSDGDGVTVVPNNPHVIHCFKCGKSNDIFHFVMEDRHCTFPEAVKTCADSAGMFIEDNYKTMKQAISYDTRKKDYSNELADMTPYFVMCHKFLTQWEEQIKILIDNGIYDKSCQKEVFHNNTATKAINYLKIRNLFDRDIIDRFNIGYDPFINCVVIPHSLNYCTRLIITDNKKIRYKNLKNANVSLFNMECLLSNQIVFVVEGTIDALSIIKAGGQAVALSGVSNVNLLVNNIKAIDKKIAIIILTDDDDAGHLAADKIIKLLDNSVFTLETHLPNRQDANDMLRTDEEALKNFVENTINEVQEKFKDWTPKTKENDIKENLPVVKTSLSIKKFARNLPILIGGGIANRDF